MTTSRSTPQGANPPIAARATPTRSSRARCAALAAALLGVACAADGARPDGAASPITRCKAGDLRVASEAACLQDDAACYELASGEWCTGERGNSCPAGSEALSAGAACPPGTRCFRVGESLTCAVGYR